MISVESGLILISSTRDTAEFNHDTVKFDHLHVFLKHVTERISREFKAGTFIIFTNRLVVFISKMKTVRCVLHWIIQFLYLNTVRLSRKP